MARVVIVGGGAGGLATAARLATRRHQVTVFDANAQVGGRLRPIDGVSLVPEIITLPAPLRDLFNKTGSGLEDALELRAAPSTLLWTAGGTTVELPSVDPAAVANALGSTFGEPVGRAYQQLMADAAELWQVVRRPLLETPGGSGRWLLDETGGWRGIRLLRPHMSYARACSAVGNDDVRALLDFDALDAGSMPQEFPAWAITRPYVRALFGEYIAVGGHAALADVLAERALARGAELRTHSRVGRIAVTNDRVSGVVLASGEEVAADWVVADTDDVDALLAGADTKVAAADLSTFVVAFTVAAADVAPSLAAAMRVTVVPVNRGVALKQLQRSEFPSDLYVRVERTGGESEKWVVRAVVNASTFVDDMSATHVLELLRQRGLLTSTESVRVTKVLGPAEVAGHINGVGGRLAGPASSSPWRGLVRPAIATGVVGLLRAGGGVLAGPGLPYAVQTGEVIADVIGRPA